MGDREYLTALSTFVPFGPARLKLLIDYFKKTKRVWNVSPSELREIGMSEKLISKFVAHRASFRLNDYFAKLRTLSVKVITMFDSQYPENLRDLTDAPYILYVRGDLRRSDSNAVAIVGSRLMTSYGREVAQKFAGGLANFGVTIVSGLALGVDAEAQRSALAVGGRTVAVLASGLDIISPAANKALALEFIKSNGAIVSEYPLGHVPFRADFAVRNRLISGMSRGVIVVEGRMKSGTFYTVRAAIDQGRPVFAVPGPITSPSSEAPNYLIQNGAKVAVNLRDVVEELNLQTAVDREEVEKVMPQNKMEVSILGYLDKEALHLDELVRISGLATPEISARLTIMEMKGLVRNLGGGIYKKN